MIKSTHSIVMDTHVIDIGHAQEYGYVCVSVGTKEFTVNVYGQHGNLISQDVHEIKRNLTVEEIAFMDAYQRNVANAPPQVVEAYLRAETDDQFCEEYGNEYYSGLADARGVWQDALGFVKDPASVPFL
jgi:hypothetical protein